jgi:hypothetical protein
MHELGNGQGLVVRALLPDAAKVEVQPVLEKDKANFTLKRIPKSDLFEGTTTKAEKVYSYDLVITDKVGKVRRTRDPYSFLPTLGEADLYLFGKGDERRIYDKLGGHLRTIDGVAGASFAVWAPNAQRISVVGDFNQWDGRFHQMRSLGPSGVWEIFIPGIGEGAHYKYEIRNLHGNIILKTDPYGFFFETPPKNAAILWDNRKFSWTDDAWLTERRRREHVQGDREAGADRHRRGRRHDDDFFDHFRADQRAYRESLESVSPLPALLSRPDESSGREGARLPHARAQQGPCHMLPASLICPTHTRNVLTGHAGRQRRSACAWFNAVHGEQGYTPAAPCESVLCLRLAACSAVYFATAWALRAVAPALVGGMIRKIGRAIPSASVSGVVAVPLAGPRSFSSQE